METWKYRYDDTGNEIFRIWEKTSPTPEYPGSAKISGSWQREVPTVYEWRHYNGFHQLIKVNQDDKEITYQYRGDGLRHSSEVQELTKGQSKTKVCYWDGTDIVAEQADGGSVKSYFRGINLLAGEADGMVYYYILNEHGDVAQLPVGNALIRDVGMFEDRRGDGFISKNSWFASKVVNKGAWNLKYREDDGNHWEETLGIPFWGYQTEMVLDGYFVRVEDVGNITYGYLGTAVGFSQSWLNTGSSVNHFAGHGVTQWDNERADQANFAIGINWYNTGKFK